jgi:N-acetylated-alpha-linked acidic dipeptidase
VTYAPGQYTGYAALVIPGINEAIDKHDLELTQQQVAVLTAALNRAAKILAHPHQPLRWSQNCRVLPCAG